MTATSLPPIVRTVSVSWPPAEAFRRFTADFSSWWPRKTHSIGGQRVEKIVFETRVAGRIFEQHIDGRRFQWGKVVEWSPPGRVRFSWHPARDECTAQDVVIEFAPEGTGTRVTLTSTGWERWGDGAAKARKMYDMGWGWVLNHWAGKRSLKMSIISGLAGSIRLYQRVTGRSAIEIDKAGGEIERATPGRE